MYYLDENNKEGVYEYYVVTHYTNGCISDISDIVIVSIEDMYEVTFEVKDIENIAISDATIAINETELTTDNQGIAFISLFDGKYFYNVTKAGYTSLVHKLR